MTELNAPVTRKTRGKYNVLYAGDRNARQIVVTLGRGDVLEFSEYRRRETWLLPIDTAFKQAVRLTTLAKAREKRRAA